MMFRQVVTFHSGINKPNTLFLYEATLLGKWLQRFRQTVSGYRHFDRQKVVADGSTDSKGLTFKSKNVKHNSLRSKYNHNFSSKSAGNR
jgi:hypothetical protein